MFVYEVTVKMAKSVFESVSVILDAMGVPMPTKFETLLKDGYMTVTVGLTQDDWDKIVGILPALGKVCEAYIGLIEAAGTLEEIQPVTTINGLSEEEFQEKIASAIADEIEEETE